MTMRFTAAKPFTVLLILSFVTLCHGYSTTRQRVRSNSEVSDGYRRRQFVSGAIVASSSWIAQGVPSEAASPTSPSEAVRRSGGNIPGLGQTDVFYPLSFNGKWNAKREIVTSDTVDASKLPLTISYEMRFIQSIEDTAVVADRGFNEASLVNAIQSASRRDVAPQPPLYQWTETNPNDLRLTFGDGTRKEVKVTKRATDRTDDTVSSSEFQRITQEDARGIPVISAHRVLTKWKVVDDKTMEGIEIVYDVGSGLGDPLMATPSASNTPRIISKSRLRLERIQQ